MNISKKLLLFFTIFTSSLIFAQSPCVGGFATHTTNGVTTSYPCDGYDLLSRVPIATLATTLGNEEGSDIWGWTDPLTGKEYAIVGTTNSTAFVDISDPINPLFLGRIETVNNNTSFWRDVKVYNNHAYIVADGVGAHGMQVFDLTILRNGVDSDLTFDGPQVLRFTGNGGTGDLTIGSCHNIVINESEDVAYLVGCSGAASGGPVFVDITNPSNPTVVGSYAAKGYTHDAQVITYNGTDNNVTSPTVSGVSSYIGREILLASNGGSNDRVVLLDVTEKNNPQFISEITYPNPGYAHQGWFTDDHRYFIFGDETDEQNFGFGTRTFVFDMLDLDNPVLISTYEASFTAIDHNGYVKDDKFYLANYRAGLRVLDIPTLISTNNSNSEIGYFDTYPASNSANFNGAWSIYPYFSSGNIIVSDIERGLFVLRPSDMALSTDTFKIDNTFSISPNPATQSNITIKASATINTVEVYSILGKKLISKSNINTDSYVLPIPDLSNGIYLVKINNSVSKKLIVNN